MGVSIEWVASCEGRMAASVSLPSCRRTPFQQAADDELEFCPQRDFDSSGTSLAAGHLADIGGVASHFTGDPRVEPLEGSRCRAWGGPGALLHDDQFVHEPAHFPAGLDHSVTWPHTPQVRIHSAVVLTPRSIPAASISMRIFTCENSVLPHWQGEGFSACFDMFRPTS